MSMTLKDTIVAKSTSIMAMLLLVMGLVLSGKFIFADLTGKEEVLFQNFMNVLSAILGYYIGRDRQQPQQPPGSGTTGNGAER